MLTITKVTLNTQIPWAPCHRRIICEPI